jgi:hypothetical protein
VRDVQSEKRGDAHSQILGCSKCEEDGRAADP